MRRPRRPLQFVARKSIARDILTRRIAVARLYESLGTSWAATDRDRAIEWYRKCRNAYLAMEKSGALGPQLASELAAVEKKLGAGSPGTGAASSR